MLIWALQPALHLQADLSVRKLVLDPDTYRLYILMNKAA